jgi:cyclopropane fatty-acyl-phospholipid synthase-like methyltransferase
MATKRGLQKWFQERYSHATTDASLIVEREAIGANVGAVGFTTVAQADLLAESLELGPGKVLLDVGSGRGWPGLYLAQETGCTAVLSDLPDAAVRSALQRSQTLALDDRVRIVRASATHLPFAPRSFDAVSHTDAL